MSAFVAPFFFYYALRELQRGQYKSGPDSMITVNASMVVSLCPSLCTSAIKMSEKKSSLH